MRWNNANRNYYESKGYCFTHYNDYFYVNVEDLSYGSNVKLAIICDDCGREYEMTCRGYFKGYDKSINNNTPLQHFCKECKLKHTQERLYNSALKVCEVKGYVLLSDRSEILCNTSYIKYLCPFHGEHQMRVSNFICGKGCPDCAPENNRNLFKLSFDEVERRILECGGRLLNKEDYINQTEKNLLIECFECGEPFLTSLRNFTQHGGQVCSRCKCTESIGESKIRHYLIKNNINFTPQKWFADCRDRNPLPFDFYLEDYAMIIEFDGRQHFEETEHFTYPLSMVQKHDRLKNEYCYKNGMRLIRIPYWNINKIEQILDKELILHEDIV